MSPSIVLPLLLLIEATWSVPHDIAEGLRVTLLPWQIAGYKLQSVPLLQDRRQNKTPGPQLIVRTRSPRRRN